MSEPKTFTATMRVIHIETWTVEAKDKDEARDKIEQLRDDVNTDETGGEVIDWKIQSLKEVSW